ncbi:MAG: Hsp70 family protein [Armatimonadetes bacterium]|nr:Hsp70 family protein [Armatimonadota bacterium]
MDIGIDLGTTFSVIAVAGRVELAPDYPAGLYLDECDVTIIPTPYGDETFPSVVIDDPERPGEHLFGLDAAQQAQEGRAPVMFSKRKIGTREGIPLGEGEVLARDVAALFLAYLKQCAEQALGRPVERAVVTHPAYFDRGAVEETREAAVQAGFDMSEPDQMLMEPVAAALAYARTDARDPLRILTYDLGGGTFDVTYLERRGGVIDMRAFDGNHLLGGFNFDRELVYWLRQRLEAQGRWRTLDEEDPDDRGRLARLLQAAETVKLNLAGARSDTTPVDFRLQYVLTDAQGRPLQVNERLTRAEFVELLQPYLQDTLDGCRRALRKAGVEADALDEVLLVGGSSQAPWVAACLAAEFAAAEPSTRVATGCCSTRRRPPSWTC